MSTNFEKIKFLITKYQINLVAYNKDEAQHDFCVTKNPLFQEVQTRPSYHPWAMMAQGMPHHQTSLFVANTFINYIVPNQFWTYIEQ